MPTTRLDPGGARAGLAGSTCWRSKIELQSTRPCRHLAGGCAAGVRAIASASQQGRHPRRPRAPLTPAAARWWRTSCSVAGLLAASGVTDIFRGAPTVRFSPLELRRSQERVSASTDARSSNHITGGVPGARPTRPHGRKAASGTGAAGVAGRGVPRARPGPGVVRGGRSGVVRGDLQGRPGGRPRRSSLNRLCLRGAIALEKCHAVAPSNSGMCRDEVRHAARAGRQAGASPSRKGYLLDLSQARGQRAGNVTLCSGSRSIEDGARSPP